MSLLSKKSEFDSVFEVFKIVMTPSYGSSVIESGFPGFSVVEIAKAMLKSVASPIVDTREVERWKLSKWKKISKKED